MGIPKVDIRRKVALRVLISGHRFRRYGTAIAYQFISNWSGEWIRETERKTNHDPIRTSDALREEMQ
jgi:hypothetical protein